jgi:hypothetical protein
VVGEAPGSLGSGRGPLPRVGEVGYVVGEGRGRPLSRGLGGTEGKMKVWGLKMKYMRKGDLRRGCGWGLEDIGEPIPSSL